MVIDITPRIISNILLFLFISASINKTKANKIHNLSNKNKPKSVKIEIGSIGITKTKDTSRNITIDIILVLSS